MTVAHMTRGEYCGFEESEEAIAQGSRVGAPAAEGFAPLHGQASEYLK